MSLGEFEDSEKIVLGMLEADSFEETCGKARVGTSTGAKYGRKKTVPPRGRTVSPNLLPNLPEVLRAIKLPRPMDGYINSIEVVLLRTDGVFTMTKNASGIKRKARAQRRVLHLPTNLNPSR
jgi:hypothetical protein